MVPHVNINLISHFLPSKNLEEKCDTARANGFIPTFDGIYYVEDHGLKLPFVVVQGDQQIYFLENGDFDGYLYDPSNQEPATVGGTISDRAISFLKGTLNANILYEGVRNGEYYEGIWRSLNGSQSGKFKMKKL